MRIDETFGHQLAAGIDFGGAKAIEMRRNRGDAAVCDADVGVLPGGGAAQAGTADRDIEHLSHDSPARSS
jgi:hypothetical protein